jgi:hypothetical protein
MTKTKNNNNDKIGEVLNDTRDVHTKDMDLATTFKLEDSKNKKHLFNNLGSWNYKSCIIETMKKKNCNNGENLFSSHMFFE